MRWLPKDVRAACALAIATALVHAPFAQADAQMIAISNCNGGMTLLVVPGEDGAPGEGGNDCAKACHGTCERRAKPLGKRAESPR